jgi:hypothetical protein
VNLKGRFANRCDQIFAFRNSMNVTASQGESGVIDTIKIFLCPLAKAVRPSSAPLDLVAGFLSLNNKVYSLRNATMGSTFAALRAGM